MRSKSSQLYSSQRFWNVICIGRFGSNFVNRKSIVNFAILIKYYYNFSFVEYLSVYIFHSIFQKNLIFAMVEKSKCTKPLCNRKPQHGQLVIPPDEFYWNITSSIPFNKTFYQELNLSPDVSCIIWNFLGIRLLAEGQNRRVPRGRELGGFEPPPTPKFFWSISKREKS